MPKLGGQTAEARPGGAILRIAKRTQHWAREMLGCATKTKHLTNASS